MPSIVGKLTRGASFAHLINLGGLGTDAPTAVELTDDKMDLTQDTSVYIVDGQGSANDDLDGIDVSDGRAGMFLLIRAANGVTITLKDENAGAAADSDKIRLPGGTDVDIEEDEAALLYHDETLNRWIMIAGPAAVGGGEANTGSDLGGTAGTFKQKAGVDLEFRGITGGTGISVTENATDIDIDGHIETFHYSITVEDPSSSEDISIAFTNVAITITEIRAVLIGSSTPSVTWKIRHHATDRTNAGNAVVTAGTTTSSTTTGSDVTAFDDATIPADSFIWFETTAHSGTVTEIHITIIGTMD